MSDRALAWEALKRAARELVEAEAKDESHVLASAEQELRTSAIRYAERRIKEKKRGL